MQKTVGIRVPWQEPNIQPKATTQPGLSRWQAAPLAPSLLARFGKALKNVNHNFLLQLIGAAAKWLIWLLSPPRVLGRLRVVKAQRLGRWRGTRSLTAGGPGPAGNARAPAGCRGEAGPGRCVVPGLQ